MKMARIAAALSFAHLIGRAASKADEDDQDRKKRDDESDEDYAKRMEEQDKEDAARKADEEKKEEEAKRKAEEEDEEADAEDKSDDEEEGKRKGRAKSARQRERTRCAAIFGCASAGRRPDMAAHFAVNSAMSASEAIASLDAIAAGEPKLIEGISMSAEPFKRATLADRMAETPVQTVGADGGSNAPAGITKVAAAIIAAGEKARGETAKK